MLDELRVNYVCVILPLSMLVILPLIIQSHFAMSIMAILRGTRASLVSRGHLLLLFTNNVAIKCERICHDQSPN